MKNIFCLSLLMVNLTVHSFAVSATESVDENKKTLSEAEKKKEPSELKPAESLQDKIEAGAEKTQKAMNKASQKVSDELDMTREQRKNNRYFALFNYSHFDLLIPAKIGATLGWNSSVDNTWELEYLRGTLKVPFVVEDLGSLTDQRLSLIRRSYAGNSFNFNYGLSYFSLKLHLGDEILNKITGVYPSYDIVELSSLGFNLGIGNRWIINKNITLGVDWLQWSQPVYILSKKSAFLDYATDPNDRDDVETAIKIFSYFPRFTLLKLQLGVTF